MFKQTTRDLRRINRAKALREIYFNGPISRLEICQHTELSQATVANVVAELIKENLVAETGSKESDGGRPTALLTIHPEYGYIIGIEVGETVIQLSLFDLGFQEVYAVCQPLSLEENLPELVVQRIVDGVEQLLSGSQVTKERLLGVGMGFPGLVERQSGVSVFAPSWGWHDVPLRSILESRLGLPIAMDNGAKAMALAENMFGAGRGTRSMAVVLMGTGIGSGIIENGALYRGAMNAAGELGHTTLEIHGRQCHCGKKGCLEAYVGAPAIISRYQETARPEDPQLSGDQKQMLEMLARAARTGNATARKVLDDTLEYLSVGIGNLVSLTNPQLILLGGWAGMMLAEDFLPRLSESVSQFAMQIPFRKTTLGLCQLRESVAQGAAALILEQLLQLAGNTQALSKAVAESGL